MAAFFGVDLLTVDRRTADFRLITRRSRVLGPKGRAFEPCSVSNAVCIPADLIADGQIAAR
jgi:hypothetical protein